MGGLAFVIPYWLAAAFVGPEFPSLLGGLIGLAFMTFAARRGILIPKDKWDFPDKVTWPSDWQSGVQKEVAKLHDEHAPLPLWKAWTPYVLVAVILVLTRLPALPLGGWLKSVVVTWTGIFGTDIAASSKPLYLPGTVLILVVFATRYLHGMKRGDLPRAFAASSKVLVGAGFVLVFTVPMVRVLIESGQNGGQYASMPIALAAWVSDRVGQVWPMFSGMIGALGAFIAGSNTVSNMMLSEFQYGVAMKLGMSGLLIVSLQAVGAAAGNMIAIHNVVAASATVGLLGQEGSTLRKTVLPTIYYLLVVGVLGLLAVHGFDVPDPL
jgi:lactate permease